MVSRVLLVGLLPTLALLPFLHCFCAGVETLFLTAGSAIYSASHLTSIVISAFFFDLSRDPLPTGAFPLLNVSGASFLLFWWMLERCPLIEMGKKIRSE